MDSYTHLLKKNRDILLRDLLFSKEKEYEILINEYILDIYQYDSFIDDIKCIFKKAKVMIIKEEIIVESKNIIWILKVKK